MTSLAPAPRTAFPIASLPEVDPPALAFFGRSLAEYTQCFALDLAAWRGRDVLDVAAGPSSFAAEACARRIDAVAVDPHYGDLVGTLATRFARDHSRRLEEQGARPPLFRGLAGRAWAAAAADRRAAAQRFLADYETHFSHGRYVGGSLPLLPFFDTTFDLVLCAHLLFTPATPFDSDWHLAAGRELMRVSAGEVRIHPLGGADGRPYSGLARLRREWRAQGIASQIVAVDGGDFAGATEMLVLRRAAA